MNHQHIPNRGALRAHTFLTAAVALAACLLGQAAFGSIKLYSDDFQSYPVQNPAPNPLTNGPAGGQWYFVDPTPPMTANKHRTFDSTVTGSGLNSRCWISLTNDARLTNEIAISALPAGAGPYTFRLSFVAATDTGTATRNTTFKYAISSSAGTLTPLSGRNLDNSQTFTDLTGYGLASAGTIGKSADRRFEFVFQGTNLTTADKIIFDVTRVTNNAGAAAYFALDDVLLTVDDGQGPLVQSVRPLLTLQHVRVAFSEPVDPTTAISTANYAFSGGALSVSNAWLVEPGVVELLTTDQTPGSNYTLQVSGVLSQLGASMTATQLDFTTPALVVSSVRYDAGTTISQPSGPPDPISAEGGYWVMTANTNNGMLVGAVTDDLSTGLNAWKVSDQGILSSSGILDYRIPIDQPSDNLARAKGWRLLLRSRLVDNYLSTANDQVVIYGDTGTGTRYGLFFALNASGSLTANVLGGATYALADSSTALGYHTHMMIYEPAVARASYYFDGQLIVTNIPANASSAYNGLAFGAASSTAAGEMNYNLVQLDVIGGTPPVLTHNPQSTTNGVGQKVTFTAGFTPFVNAYQWLSNGVIIPGATGTNYTTDFITLGYDGSQYSCRALHPLGNVETAPATLTVTDDTAPPAIVSVKGSLLLDRVLITFSEPVLESYATDIANYVWSVPGVANLSAQLVDPLTVELHTTSLQAGGSYAFLVSNVRDTSNLIIPANSPAQFTAPRLQVLARYYAGNTTDTPAGPPDPTSAEGGGWALRLDPDASLSTNAVMDDLGTGWHAWQVRDASAATQMFIQYTLGLATNVHQNAKQFGWVLTVRSRFAEDFGTGMALFAQYADYNYYRYVLSFDQDSFGELEVGLWVPSPGYIPYTVTTGGTGSTAYYLHQVVYDPATATASYFMDGRPIARNWGGGYSSGSNPGLFWGAASSANMGTMNYNLVEFQAVEPPFVSIVNDGTNILVEYRGILEAASQFANPTSWTPLATNATSAASTFSIPLSSSQPQQYFRARLVQ